MKPDRLRYFRLTGTGSSGKSYLLGAIAICLCIGLLATYLLIDFDHDGPYSLSNYAFTTRYSLDEMRAFAFKNSLAKSYKPSLYVKWNLSFNRIFEDSDNRFDIDGRDVIVFLHMQKTAGTSFERFLVNHLNISRPCTCNVGKKRCTCLRPGTTDKEYWLFSRYSTGWACGLHADFTELSASGCVDHVMDKKEGAHRKRRYFYTTFLRDPIERFISEYRHVNRGATWRGSRHVCNGRPPTPDQLPMCFDPEVGWEGVLLDEFLACPYNMAFNRQTRMLADLTLVNCYDRGTMNATTRDRIILESAKSNLRNFAYFGIKERMEESQLMFEEVFQLRFTRNLADWNKSKSHDTAITPLEMKAIRAKNYLDIQLYDYAIKVFESRLARLRLSAQNNGTTNILRPRAVVYLRQNYTTANDVDTGDGADDDESSEADGDSLP